MGLVWVCFRTGMGLVRVCFGTGMGLVWVCFRTGSGTHFFSTFGDDGGVTSSSDDELDDESLSSDFWFLTFGLFGFNGFDFLTIGDRDLDRLDFLRGEGVRDPYLRYVSGLILRDLKLNCRHVIIERSINPYLFLLRCESLASSTLTPFLPHTFFPCNSYTASKIEILSLNFKPAFKSWKIMWENSKFLSYF